MQASRTNNDRWKKDKRCSRRKRVKKGAMDGKSQEEREEGEFLDGGGGQGGPDKDLNLVTPAYRLSLFWIFWAEGGSPKWSHVLRLRKDKRND